MAELEEVQEQVLDRIDYGTDVKLFSEIWELLRDYPKIVRCKDCKHRFNGEHHDNCCDVLMEKVKWTFEVTVEPDWFCGDGKREDT